MESGLKVTVLKIDELRGYAKNSRTHSPEQIAKIARSIEEFGWTNPILIGRDGVIIAGHARLEAAKSMGLSEVPTIELAHLSPAQARAYVIADNRLAEDAGWDDAVLASELAALEMENYDLTLSGFGEDEIAKLLGRDDEPPPTSKALPEGLFEIVVICKTEAEQEEVYERLQLEGYQVRVLGM